VPCYRFSLQLPVRSTKKLLSTVYVGLIFVPAHNNAGCVSAVILLLEHFVLPALACINMNLLFLYPKKPLLVSVRFVTEVNPLNLRRHAGSS